MSMPEAIAARSRRTVAAPKRFIDEGADPGKQNDGNPTLVLRILQSDDIPRIEDKSAVYILWPEDGTWYEAMLVQLQYEGDVRSCRAVYPESNEEEKVVLDELVAGRSMAVLEKRASPVVFDEHVIPYEEEQRRAHIHALAAAGKLLPGQQVRGGSEEHMGRAGRGARRGMSEWSDEDADATLVADAGGYVHDDDDTDLSEEAAAAGGIAPADAALSEQGRPRRARRPPRRPLDDDMEIDSVALAEGTMQSATAQAAEGSAPAFQMEAAPAAAAAPAEAAPAAAPAAPAGKDDALSGGETLLASILGKPVMRQAGVSAFYPQSPAADAAAPGRIQQPAAGPPPPPPPAQAAKAAISQQSSRGLESIGSGALQHKDIRSKAREQLQAALERSVEEVTKEHKQEGKAPPELPGPGKIAADVEAALFDNYKGTGKDYKTKYRSLYFNMRDPSNQELRRRVLMGELSPHVVVRMSATDLANRDVQMKRQQKAEEFDRMKVLDDETAARFSTAAAASAAEHDRKEGKIRVLGKSNVQDASARDAADVVVAEPMERGPSLASWASADSQQLASPPHASEPAAAKPDAAPPSATRPPGVSRIGAPSFWSKIKEQALTEAAIHKASSPSHEPGDGGDTDQEGFDEGVEAADAEDPGADAPARQDASTAGPPGDAAEAMNRHSPVQGQHARRRGHRHHAHGARSGHPLRGELGGGRGGGGPPGGDAPPPPPPPPALAEDMARTGDVVWEGTLRSAFGGQCPVQCEAVGGGCDLRDVLLGSTLDVKGRVNLEELGRFFKDLRRSRTRSVTVGLLKDAPSAAEASGETTSLQDLVRQCTGKGRAGVVEPEGMADCYIVPKGSLSDFLLRQARTSAPADVASLIPPRISATQLLLAITHRKDFVPPPGHIRRAIPDAAVAGAAAPGGGPAEDAQQQPAPQQQPSDPRARSALPPASAEAAAAPAAAAAGDAPGAGAQAATNDPRLSRRMAAAQASHAAAAAAAAAAPAAAAEAAAVPPPPPPPPPPAEAQQKPGPGEETQQPPGDAAGPSPSSGGAATQPTADSHLPAGAAVAPDTQLQMPPAPSSAPDGLSLAAPAAQPMPAVDLDSISALAAFFGLGAAAPGGPAAPAPPAQPAESAAAPAAAPQGSGAGGMPLWPQASGSEAQGAAATDGPPIAAAGAAALPPAPAPAFGMPSAEPCHAPAAPLENAAAMPPSSGQALPAAAEPLQPPVVEACSAAMPSFVQTLPPQPQPLPAPPGMPGGVVVSVSILDDNSIPLVPVQWSGQMPQVQLPQQQYDGNPASFVPLYPGQKPPCTAPGRNGPMMRKVPLQIPLQPRPNSTAPQDPSVRPLAGLPTVIAAQPGTGGAPIMILAPGAPPPAPALPLQALQPVSNPAAAGVVGGMLNGPAPSQFAPQPPGMQPQQMLPVPFLDNMPQASGAMQPR